MDLISKMSVLLAALISIAFIPYSIAMPTPTSPIPTSDPSYMRDTELLNNVTQSCFQWRYANTHRILTPADGYPDPIQQCKDWYCGENHKDAPDSITCSSLNALW